MKKKYYYLINSLECGGAERVCINLAHNLFKEGTNTYIITLKSALFYDLPVGIHHIALSHITNNFLMFLLIPWYVWKFKKVINKLKLSEGMSLLEIANFVHILAKKDAIISFRIHINFFKGFYGGIQKLGIKNLYPKAAKIIVNSEENKYDLLEYLNIQADKVDVLYNPIDIIKINKFKNEKVEKYILNRITGKNVYITTGRLVWQKHHEKIIKAIAGLPDRNRIYLIIGDGPNRKLLEKLVVFLGIQNNVIFLGQKMNVYKYLALADTFLYASEVEGFPNVLMEAKAIGLPIITSDFKSGAKEVIIGEYTKEIGKTIQYPYYGKYGILLNLSQYENQFLNVYKNV